LAKPLAWDRYAYANNNSVGCTDPSGHCPFCLEIAFGILDWLIETDLQDGHFDTPNDINSTVTLTATVLKDNPFNMWRDPNLRNVLAGQKESGAPDLTDWLVETMDRNAKGEVATILKKAYAGG
jgi:hypothetical protein